MRSIVGGKRFLVAGALCAGTVVGAPASAEGASRSCAPVLNPYPGTRYEGVDLRRIRATAVTCRDARRVARGAHRKALGRTPAPNGLLPSFHWHGWWVSGDLRGARDLYVATHGDRRVRWFF